MNMKKIAYISPAIETLMVDGEQLLEISVLTGIDGIDGLDIDETPTDAEGLSRALDLPFEF